jgi:hypothetical protein
MGCDTPANEEIMESLPPDLKLAITGIGRIADEQKGVIKELGNTDKNHSLSRD